MKTLIQEVILDIEGIKKNHAKTVKEAIFFDAILAILEVKYLPKEKQQIIEIVSDFRARDTAEKYFNETFENT